ncbi:hypothetical protein HNQ77_001079 [Silvibacterium bohemicum]|uniref:Uncharacterized protein n=1 Tax=Silvibacterium bohemicum TaxID=1577686 RepID=A0A841JRV4_9BACT|nr:hypothetical protein [Silvibacterium bohemicum]MBB6143135.1 hypothetical protein [Silvibacterium bohemicum]
MPGHSETKIIPNAALVREQLNRLLAHPLFTNSKRYPVLLAYTVEQALLGNAGELKERTIGVEAFGREPNYDVNLDPVVRTTAAEVRKRLIQYYYSPDHAGELIIELPLGSYVPLFREPSSHTAVPTDTQLGDESPEAFPQGPIEAETRSVDSPKGSSGRAVHAWIPIALLVTGLLGFGLGHVRFPGQTARPGASANPSDLSNMSRFWEPITATSSRVTYCLGVPTDSVDLQSRTIPPIPAGETGSLNVYDVITLARSIAPLVPKNGEFRVLAGSETGFAQLREGPSVMIGAFDNPWTMRITQDLPIGFEYDNHVRKVVDRKSVPRRMWTLEWQVPLKSLARDYAVVARIHDQVSGQPVIILAGILGEGTEAASEVVSNSAYLDAMLKKAPKNWDQLNLEAVIEANVIEGHPGPPTVIAVETW